MIKENRLCLCFCQAVANGVDVDVLRDFIARTRRFVANTGQEPSHRRPVGTGGPFLKEFGGPPSRQLFRQRNVDQLIESRLFFFGDLLGLSFQGGGKPQRKVTFSGH